MKRKFIHTGERACKRGYLFPFTSLPDHAHTHTHAHTQTLHGRQDERVLHELREWQNNFIDVQHYMDNLAVARGRARNLKEEVGSGMKAQESV